MKKVELLSPVGNKDMLYQAIHNGADAVYLAGNKFGARKFANNFTNEELVEAIKYCHLFGVKIYVAVNTLIYDEEVDELIDYIRFLHKNNVDALIMQDLGMIKLVRDKFPNLEIHASTQAHNHNSYGIKFFEDLGIKRIVMAREMSLNEINSINTPLEKEVFVYGALCVSYSGCCLFSSLNGGRSGNRGECVGSCRLPYKIKKNNEVIKGNGNYPLSLREFNTLNNLKQILDSNIDSLKIEGRMKSPEYVGYVTALYRKLIDKYYNNEELILTDEEIKNLKKIFNRKFTSGFLFNDKNISNINTPNHQGIEIGKVIKITKKYIYIKLSEDINQEDAIRFKNYNKGMIVNRLYDDKELLKSNIKKDKVCLVDNKIGLKDDDIVLKTIDKKLIDELDNIKEMKINITIDATFKVNKESSIKVSDGINEVIVSGNTIEKAIKSETTIDKIKEQLSKTGNTVFKINEINIDKDDNIFVNIKDINDLRRDALSKLKALRENTIPHIFVENKIPTLSENINTNNINISVSVKTNDQLKACLENDIKDIYIDNDILKLDKYIYKLDRVNNTYKDLDNKELLISEIGSIYKYKDNNILYGNCYLNVTNSYTVDFLNNYLKRTTLSLELNDNQTKNIKCKKNCELYIYGRPELMIMKYCPLKSYFGSCQKCYEHNDKYTLVNDKKDEYPIISKNCMTTILHSKIINKIDNINKYSNQGYKNFRIDLFNESYDETINIINKIKKATN